MNIPDQMNALQIERYEEDIQKALDQLRIVKKTVPSPGPGQVLIKIEAAPCNPSDLLFMQGRYGVRKTLPTTPGWEGAGTVVATGGGLMGWWLKGKRVAFAIQSDSDGTWAEYCLVDAKMCVPLKDSIDFDQGSTLIINPISAIGLMQKAKVLGHKALVQNAAASQLGRMVINLASRASIPLINIVRRQEQVELSKSLGAQYVLNSEEETFLQDLKNLSAKLEATCAFDAIAGPMTGIMLSALPKGSIIYVYGGLSGKLCSEISPLSLIFESKRVEGFWLTKWIGEQGSFGMLKVLRETQNLMTEGVIKTSIYKTVSLVQVPAALKEYVKEMSQGKVIIKPSKGEA